MARAFLYHIFDDDDLFKNAAPLAAMTVKVIEPDGSTKKDRQMYSLKRDMAELRRIGATKFCLGTPIVDPQVQVGVTDGGKELLVLKVGVGSHKVLILGCHHAREWISVEMPYYIAEYLINTYTDTPSTPKEKRIKHLLMNRQIWFVPMVNPDGHIVTVTSNRDWRQNNASHSVPAGSVVRPTGTVSWPAGTYTGVDINRNYDTKAVATHNGAGTFLAWGVETFLGTSVRTSRDPRDSAVASQVWCGPDKGSEKETAAIQKLINDNGFRSTISFHSFGQQWLWPGPLLTGSDDPYTDWVGNGTVTAMGTAGIKYKFTGGPDPYPTSGDMIDFVFQTVAGWRPAYTPEVRPSDADSAHGFSLLLENQIEPCFKENLAATLAVINCAGHDAESTNVSVTTTTGDPPQRCQFVRKCWEVFKGWTP